jgi:hypothetical protein
MADVKASTAQGKGKWYNHYKFPLIPRLEVRKADKHNTGGFTFNWLFFTVWSLDSFTLELSFVCSGHWGIGVIGVLPYLRWCITIPCPYSLQQWVWDNLDRKPKGYTGYL